ncbi:MAG: class A beta-lactamase-related serine hydrolase [Planctomycetota bacterium]|nr:MAG: class A beta-lactamase-related serine hydrolase [Planctomycetota bacterium]
MRTTVVAALSFAALVVRVPSAQEPVPTVAAPRDVAALLEPIRVAHDLPGLIGLTLEGERVVALGATGLRKSGNDTKILATDRVHIGSCAKAITATLCARLVQQGKLRYDSTLAEVFPDAAGKMHESWRGVTLEQLLQHRSGAPANVKPDRSGSARKQRDRIFAAVIAAPTATPPGSAYEYSNVGYTLAGHMAEQVAGIDFEELVLRDVFAPLSIESAGFGAPGVASALSQPRGHKEMGLAIEPGPAADNPLGIAPAGAIHMAIEDWAKFVALHLAGEKDGWRTAAGETLLPAEAFAKLHAPPEGGDYACGWAVAKRPWAGGRVLTHSGSNTMWYCTTWLAPERGFALLVATNQGGAKAAKGCDAAVGALLQEYLKSQTGKAK